MLKKSDLAKQFELVVQQEITNYNNSLNQILQSLKSLQDQINEIKDFQKKIVDTSESKHTELKTSLSNLKQEHDDHVKRLYRMNNDQIDVSRRNAGAINTIVSEVNARLSYVGNFKANMDNVHDQIDKHGQHWKACHQHLAGRIDDLHTKISKEILKSKNEILNAPSDSSIVRKDLEEQIYAHKVDVQGIMRELNIYKKEAYIVEKKLENIYTLIDRLQKGDK